jgi:pyrroline-5-carboxylate reductase
MVTVSVIGCGNMGSALIAGLSRAGGHEIVAADLDTDALAAVEEHCTRTTTDPSEADDSEVVFVAVKPDIVGAVLDDIDVPAESVLVTIAAGVTTDYVAPHTDAHVVRLMPNLAAETGTMAGAVAGDPVPDVVRDLLADLGEYAEIEESLMDTATALNGSGPAFVFYLVAAMRDGAVAEGMDREAAETLAAQTFKGAAETVLRSDRSIEELIDAVCSPNGTTIEGMESLWDSPVEDEVAAAVEAAAPRSRELSAEVGDE